MLGNERDLNIAKDGHDHHTRPSKHDIIFDIHIHSNKLIFNIFYYKVAAFHNI